MRTSSDSTRPQDEDEEESRSSILSRKQEEEITKDLEKKTCPYTNPAYTSNRNNALRLL